MSLTAFPALLGQNISKSNISIAQTAINNERVRRGKSAWPFASFNIGDYITNSPVLDLRTSINDVESYTWTQSVVGYPTAACLNEIYRQINLLELGSVFEPIRGTAPIVNTGYVIGGVDIAQLFMSKALPNLPSATAPATGFLVGGVDINQLFQPLGYAPGITARVTFTTTPGGSTYTLSALAAIIGYQPQIVNVVVIGGGGGSGSGAVDDGPGDAPGGGGGGGAGLVLTAISTATNMTVVVGVGGAGGPGSPAGLGGPHSHFDAHDGSSGGSSIFIGATALGGGAGGGRGAFSGQTSPGGGGGGASGGSILRAGGNGGNSRPNSGGADNGTSTATVGLATFQGTMFVGGASGGANGGTGGGHHASGGGGGGGGWSILGGPGTGGRGGTTGGSPTPATGGQVWGGGGGGGDSDYEEASIDTSGTSGGQGLIAVYY